MLAVPKRITFSFSSITSLFTIRYTYLWLNFQCLFPQSLEVTIARAKQASLPVGRYLCSCNSKINSISLKMEKIHSCNNHFAWRRYFVDILNACIYMFICKMYKNIKWLKYLTVYYLVYLTFKMISPIFLPTEDYIIYFK